jgi:nucleoside-diphosphate-sugar epimerase
VTDERRVIVDGATGYVGSNLVRSLTDDGHRTIALTRQSECDTRARVAAAVSAGPGPFAGADNLDVRSFSLLAPDLGLDDDGLEALFGAPCDYWHLAANVNFRPGNQHAVTDTNVLGTRNTLEAFRKHAKPGSRYFLVSTAYCCGRDVDQPDERWYESAAPSHFRNFYELSKREAEIEARAMFEDFGITGAVLRLGQVVGDSRTGMSSSDYGMYNLIRAVWAVARRRPNELVRIEGHPEANLHLVPVDVCVRWMRDVSRSDVSAASPPIFHIVDHPQPAQAVVDALARHIPLRVSIVPPIGFEAKPATTLERVVAARVAYTGSYLAQPFTFGRGHLEGVTSLHDAVVDDDMLDRMIGSYTSGLMADAPPLHSDR